jgi:L-seryl-tRNA(Ser) seleniumtransferase
VDALLRHPDGRALVGRHGRAPTVEALREALASARAARRPVGAAEAVALAARRLDAPPSLRRVLNATGIIVHTNMGRAPLPAAALDRVQEVAQGYSTLELDLEGGERSSRHRHVAGLVRDLTGAEDGLAVNNNAGATLLAIAALAAGREVLVSRGELIEIGDGFRIPEVLAASGARLVEVGTTNRTRVEDYRRAVTSETAAILRVHQSNFRIVGFTERPPLDALASLAAEHGLALIDDLGSGQVLGGEPFGDEPTARDSVAAGATLVCFSGDKLLGGPQAGILAGAAAAVEAVRRHPLARALRIDKLSLAALVATLEILRDPTRAEAEIPVLRMAHEPAEAVRGRAEALAVRLGGRVLQSEARLGGGAVPLLVLPSFACALPGGARTAAALRAGDPPVVARVKDGEVLLDCRTLTDEDLCLIPAPPLP